MENVNEVSQVVSIQLEDFLSDVFTTIAKTKCLSNVEYATFSRSGVARFIAALPFVACCTDPKNTALSHLAIYLDKIRSSENLADYNATVVSTVYEDLGLLSMFEGGSDVIIQHGMYILALIMLEGYKDRSFSDMEQGIENPLNDETWDYYTLKASLLDDIKENPCPELDALILTETGLLQNHF